VSSLALSLSLLSLPHKRKQPATGSSWTSAETERGEKGSDRNRVLRSVFGIKPPREAESPRLAFHENGNPLLPFPQKGTRQKKRGNEPKREADLQPLEEDLTPLAT
jgi:hypothetical protein